MAKYTNRFWNGKKVLITGHSGFKGCWLTAFLQKMGASIIGISDGLISEPNLFNILDHKNSVKNYWVDIQNTNELIKILKYENPEFIFHLAAQALVKKSIEDPIKTLSTNAMGMASLLDAIRLIEYFVPTILITSDKVYENKGWYWGYKETDKLGGKDPYSASKACAEIIANSYCKTFFSDQIKNFAIARAGNVIGGGDWAANRLIPDCFRSWAKGESVELRMPNATRPWQHVLEPISGYVLLAEFIFNNKLNDLEAFNFGPNFTSMSSVEKIVNFLGNRKTIVSNDTESKEANLLALNCDKAKFILEWYPELSEVETLNWTKDWYNSYYNNKDVKALTFDQINSYLARREIYV